MTFSDQQGRTSEQIIQGLQSPTAYPHPVDSIEMRETHISWILLAGAYAYKIKKPVDFGFVDFSTVERRLHFCHEEIRLNGRLAASLYLDVVPIAGTVEAPRIGGEGEPLEHAVKMHRFDDSQLLSHLCGDGELPASRMDELAVVVARFHERAQKAETSSSWTNPDRVWSPVAENFRVLEDLTDDADLLDEIAIEREWAHEEFERLRDSFADRAQSGFVRECHGDMHLGNMVLHEGRVTIFDGIDFNPDLYWIDVLSEVAFTVMDLDDRGQPNLGRRFLNGYLEQTGDYEGLALLPYYLAYRAGVRAKVAGLRSQQVPADSPEAEDALAELRDYLSLASQYRRSSTPVLRITHGLSGSGKTTGSRHWVDNSGAIRLRSDVERKRLHGLQADTHAATEPETGLYTAKASEQTYSRLLELSRSLLLAGYSPLVDATFLKRAQRDRFRSLAEELDVPFEILWFDAPVEELRRRVKAREEAGRDASDATIDVLEHQLQTVEHLAESEQRLARNASSVLENG